MFSISLQSCEVKAFVEDGNRTVLTFPNRLDII